MPRAKPKVRIVYRDRKVQPEAWFGSITISQIKQFLFIAVPLATATWAYAGPFVDAKAGEVLKSKLVEIGLDPATVQALNKNLTELQGSVADMKNASDDKVEKLTGDVNDLKVDLGKVLILLQQQPVAIPLKEPVK